jgi:hypothetical protein
MTNGCSAVVTTVTAMPICRISPAFVVGVFDGIRLTIGTAFLFAPDRLGGGPEGQPGKLMTRSFAVRELVPGIGGLLAAVNAEASPSAVRTWASLGALTDAGDLVAAVAGASRGESGSRASAFVAATGFAAELWASQSGSARPEGSTRAFQ